MLGKGIKIWRRPTLPRYAGSLSALTDANRRYAALTDAMRP